jgi:hypothetical protein
MFPTRNPTRKSSWQPPASTADAALAESLPIEAATRSLEFSLGVTQPNIQPESSTSRFLRKTSPSHISFLVSLITHTLLLLILALIAISGLSTTHNTFLVQATIDQSRSDGLLASVEIAPPKLDAQESSDESYRSGTVGSSDPAATDASALGHPKLYQPDQSGLDDSAFRLSQVVSQLALASNSDVTSDDDPEGAVAGEATFFGARAYGNKFVFVIDASTSMEGYRWNRAVGELLKSIGRLSDGAEFFIIAFHFEPVPIDISRSMSRTFLVKGKSSVVECRRWLRQLTLAPQTMPARSLQMAMDFQPDAIFLLSDGELRDNSLALLRRENQKDGKPIIPINSIHLFSNDGRETLETLAKENGGSFTAVGGKD